MWNADQKKQMQCLTKMSTSVWSANTSHREHGCLWRKDVLKRKREDPIWICSICQHDLHCELSIICESCLEWYHFIDIMCWLDCMGSLNGELVLPLLSPIMTQLVTVAVTRYTPSYFCCIVQTFHYTYHAALARQQPHILQLLVLVLFTAYYSIRSLLQAPFGCRFNTYTM